MNETSEYQIISWRDIPVQVRVRNGTERRTQPLPARFQQAAIRSAYRARAITGEAYLSAWTSNPWQPHAGDTEQTLADIIAHLEAGYPQERLGRLIENKGYNEVANHDS